MALPKTTLFCPRCDRPYTADLPKDALEKVKHHVREQHPDHDPYWYETYPDNFGT